MEKEVKWITAKMWIYLEGLVNLHNEINFRGLNREIMDRMWYLLHKLLICYQDLYLTFLQPLKGGSTLPAGGKPPMGEGKEKEVK
jgi:hypothetical protein